MLYAQEERFTLYHGDNREVLKELADNSVDSIVTDPPYELGFMGKSWDASGIAYSVELWKEALRVLKPGGHLLAFSGSRTYHRMAVAIEDAGFEIRDQIMWIYGSGFPKSLDISKAIDKSAGAEREVVGEATDRREDGTTYGLGHSGQITSQDAITAEVKQWQGWGTALKPAHEPVVVARKPLIGTVAANVLTYGTGGLNIDGARVGSEGGGTNCTNRDELGQCKGHENAGRSTTGETIHGVESNGGRWPANVIHDGSNEVVELFPDTGKSGVAINRNRSGAKSGEVFQGGWNALTEDVGFRDSGSAARFFYCAKASKRDRNEGLDGFEAVRVHDGRQEGTVGGSNRRNRSNNYRQNHHPTVKPTDLMRYLCRLVTPPNGIVLDPFMGSGSTGKAAIYEGFNFVGIEMTDEYIPIAKARIEFAVNEMAEKLL